MDVALKGREVPAHRSNGDQVSILVLLDVALKALHPIQTVLLSGVSILVLLDVALKVRPRQWGVFSVCVSILVLLDVALKVERPRLHLPESPGFNPCSLGCCSESGPGCGLALGQGGVSILVLLDVALKVYKSGRGQTHRTQFQSLFSWMLL